MKETGDYAGIFLDGMDPVKIAEGFGVEAMHVQDEAKVAECIAYGLKVVEDQKRPFLLNVHMPLGVPQGGKSAKQFRWRSNFSMPCDAAIHSPLQNVTAQQVMTAG